MRFEEDNAARFTPQLVSRLSLSPAPRPSARQWGILVLLQAAGYFGQFDRTIFGTAVPQIQSDFGLSDAEMSYAASFVGLAAVLACAVSCLSDKFGRARVLTWTLVPYTLATACTAISQGIVTFAFFQFLAQAFITAEGIISHVMVLEEMPADSRGWAIGALNTGSACGVGLALLLFGISNGAWRLMYALSILPLLGVGYVRRALPETRRWASLKDTSLSADTHDPGGLQLPAVNIGSPGGDFLGLHHEHEERSSSSPSKCHKQLEQVKQQHVAILATTFLGSLFPSSANFNVSKHIQVVHGFGATGYAKLSFIGGFLSLSAFALAGYFGDRYGRKKLGILGILLKTLVDVAFYSVAAGAESVSLIVILFCIRVALGMALDTNFQALSGEVFPTERRTSAQGILVLIGGLGGPLGLLFSTRLVPYVGTTAAAARLLACGQLICAVILCLWLPETRGRELEEINS
ncbi:Sialic acid transporter NanT 2 (Sialic acid permease 2) (Sialic acid/H(+) symporter 2) [Durusdinium trenchii]|uniref:Sialic acid transporter NanT 2 (Sialic acid permease 2) (Sialic acid/H(+) symporter 2) n=1 Tax=Durusdinium trenchii TaxID=1381693 RepID=A0ABP0PUN9_9DINO